MRTSSRDLERGPEAYLQTWERAVGVPLDSCRPDVEPLTERQLRQVRRGQSPEAVLLTLGQPRQRDGDRFTYCLRGDRTATVRFGGDGTVTRVDRGTAPASAASGPDAEPVATDRLRPAGRDAAVTAAQGHAGHGHAGHHHAAELVGATTGGERGGPLAVAILALGLTAAVIHRATRQPAR